MQAEYEPEDKYVHANAYELAIEYFVVHVGNPEEHDYAIEQGHEINVCKEYIHGFSP